MNASSLAEEISSPSSSQPHSDQEIHSNFSQIVETAEFVLSVVPSLEGSYITNNQIKQHPSSEVPCDSLALSLPEVPRNSLAPLSQDSSYHPPTPQVQHFYSWPKDYSTPPPPLPPLAPSFPEVRRNSLAPSSPQDSSDHPLTLQDQQDSPRLKIIQLLLRRLEFLVILKICQIFLRRLNMFQILPFRFKFRRNL